MHMCRQNNLFWKLNLCLERLNFSVSRCPSLPYWCCSTVSRHIWPPASAPPRHNMVSIRLTEFGGLVIKRSKMFSYLVGFKLDWHMPVSTSINSNLSCNLGCLTFSIVSFVSQFMPGRLKFPPSITWLLVLFMYLDRLFPSYSRGSGLASGGL